MACSSGRAICRPRLGYLGDQTNPAMVRDLRRCDRRIRAGRRAPGFLTGDEALARRCIEQGCLFTAVGANSGILARGSEQLADKFKN